MQLLITILEILAVLGIVGTSSVGVAVLVILAYPQARVIFADIISSIGFLSKWIRKTSVGNELEGAINVFIKDFNSQSADAILLDCKIEWINKDEEVSQLEVGKAIVRISFSKDHDINFYNAAYAYTKTGLLARTKGYLKKPTAKAIDLLMTHTILSRSHRRALVVFNNEYREIEPECKETYQKLSETEEKGLFGKILLKELHFFGEILGEAAPKEEYEVESEKFIDWFYELATREPDEFTTLNFVGNHIKVGVILIAKNETLKEHGISKYLKWANYYASNNYGCVYLLSRGPRKGKVTKQVAEELVKLGAYTNLTRKPDFIIQQGGEEVAITCIALKPDLTSILQRAWEKINEEFKTTKEVNVIVREVGQAEIIIDAHGLRVPIPLNELSDMRITDATRFFRQESELIAKILSVDPQNNQISLSIRGTESDPKKLIENNLSAEAVVTVEIQSYRIKDGIEMGMYAKVIGKSFECFIHRTKATYSRFLPLSYKYPKGSKAEARLLYFRPEFATYSGEIIGVEDPWIKAGSFKIGDIVDSVVCEVAERYINCEIIEGLEGRVSIEELSWSGIDDNLKLIKEFKPGDKTRCLIKEIDKSRHLIRLSIKKLTKSPTEEYFQKNKDTPCNCEVSQIFEGYGIKTKFGDLDLEGFVPIKEIQWGYCDSIVDVVQPSQSLKVRLLEFDDCHNRLIVSIKRSLTNDFIDFQKQIPIGEKVSGIVTGKGKKRYTIEISFDGKIAQGYVHISQLSSYRVDEATFERILKIGEKLSFIVRRMDPKGDIVEVSRKEFLKENIKNIELGEEYTVRVVGSQRNGFQVYGDAIEGIIAKNEIKVKSIGEQIQVLVAQIDIEGCSVDLTSV